MDQIIIIVIGIIIGLLINNFKKIIKYSVKYIKTICRFLKRKIKREYTLNDIIRFEEIPKEQLTVRQAKALDKVHKDMETISKDMAISMGKVNLSNMQIGTNILKRFHK